MRICRFSCFCFRIYAERAAELARVFGIDFYSVLTRGSQYRVESMMMRLAKPMNYIAVSPTRAQVAAMRAAECVPLIMEPEVLRNKPSSS
jgi:DNA polymerase zeta